MATRSRVVVSIVVLLALVATGYVVAAPGHECKSSRTPYSGGVDGVTVPKLVKRVYLQYPDGIEDKRVNARLVIRAVILKSGEVEVEEIESCSATLGKKKKRADPNGDVHCEEFRKSVQEAVPQWRYKPATLDGSPVDSMFHLVVDFTGGKKKN